MKMSAIALLTNRKRGIEHGEHRVLRRTITIRGARRRKELTTNRSASSVANGHAKTVHCLGRKPPMYPDTLNDNSEFGRLFSDPGHSAGNSAAVNQAALDELKRALLTRASPAGGLDFETRVHGSIKIFKDLNRGVDTETLRFEGTGKLDELLLFIRERFRDPVDVSFGIGISQGHTTTFKGKIRAKLGVTFQRYDIYCGFASADDRVVECWIKIAPPLTLKECLV